MIDFVPILILYLNDMEVVARTPFSRCFPCFADVVTKLVMFAVSSTVEVGLFILWWFHAMTVVRKNETSIETAKGERRNPMLDIRTSMLVWTAVNFTTKHVRTLSKSK